MGGTPLLLKRPFIKAGLVIPGSWLSQIPLVCRCFPQSNCSAMGGKVRLYKYVVWWLCFEYCKGIEKHGKTFWGEILSSPPITFPRPSLPAAEGWRCARDWVCERYSSPHQQSVTHKDTQFDCRHICPTAQVPISVCEMCSESSGFSFLLPFNHLLISVRPNAQNPFFFIVSVPILHHKTEQQALLFKCFCL